MTTRLSPPRSATPVHSSPRRPIQVGGRPLLSRSHGPFCSLLARPQPQPEPAPSWDELLGQR